MKFNLVTILFCISFISNAQAKVIDSVSIEKIPIATSYGTILFEKFCEENKAFVKFNGNFKNIDAAINEEAEKKNISKDAVIVMIEVNQTGIISSFKIVSKGKLENFNVFIEKVFNEIILEMSKGSTGKLNCTTEKMNFTFPIKYHFL